MFKSIDKDLVVEHAFVITFFFFLDLSKEKILLDEGIIEFGIGVTELVIFDEKLKPFGESRFRSMIFGQRGHELRMFNDEGRVQNHSNCGFGV